MLVVKNILGSLLISTSNFERRTSTRRPMLSFLWCVIDLKVKCLINESFPTHCVGDEGGPKAIDKLSIWLLRLWLKILHLSSLLHSHTLTDSTQSSSSKCKNYLTVLKSTHSTLTFLTSYVIHLTIMYK